jgi:hypothetical protein
MVLYMKLTRVQSRTEREKTQLDLHYVAYRISAEMECDISD